MHKQYNGSMAGPVFLSLMQLSSVIIVPFVLVYCVVKAAIRSGLTVFAHELAASITIVYVCTQYITEIALAFTRNV